jgi:nucleotide-binding universal stress UspA family protein
MTASEQPLRSDSSMKTIVVGYDGTHPAERALARAAELAQAFDSIVIVADVAAPEPLNGAMPGAFGLAPYYLYTAKHRVQRDETVWQQHRARVESFFLESGVRHEFSGVVGQPTEEIVEVAERREADLVVVGTREAGLLERLLGGSVSQGVARRAHCDVLIVHPSTSPARPTSSERHRPFSSSRSRATGRRPSPAFAASAASTP